ncbi:efflux RND transporter permease subunit, partial [Flavobacterium hydatis]
LFLPLALAIGFSMVISFLLSQTFVPVMANWLMKAHPKHAHEPGITDDEAEFNDCGLTPESEKDLITQKKAMVERDDFNNDGKISPFEKFRIRFMKTLDRLFPHKKGVTLAYLLGITCLAMVLITFIGKDVFPKVNSSQFQLRMRAPDGTRLERTEEKAIIVLKELNKMVGKEHIGISSVYVGQHPSLFSINPIYLFMAGSHEAVFQVSLKDYHADMDDFKDDFRARIKKVLPDVKLSFEPIELTDKVLSQGSPTPIEVRIAGKDKKRNELYANQIVEKLKKISYFRDVQIGQPIHYPAMNIDIDRTRAAELGVDMNDISRSLVASTSSSRYTEKNMWVDERAGLSYNVQVQVPLNLMKSKTDIGEIPVLKNSLRPVLSDVAKITPGFVSGENDNLGAMPYITVTANISQTDLGTAVKDVDATINSLGELPRGLFITPIGMSKVLVETLSSLQVGLLVAIFVIFLMLAANFQSFKVSLVILTTVPAVVLGALLMLTITGSTLNLQSYMGIIMSVGVSIANAVLLVTNAEQLRKHNGNALESAREAAALRLRPIIMTSVAMIAGMLPMAIGHGEGGDQVSPLGRAVIGGLFFSTFTVLLILPLIFAWAQEKATTQSVSLDPEDEESIHYISSLNPKNGIATKNNTNK